MLALDNWLRGMWTAQNSLMHARIILLAHTLTGHMHNVMFIICEYIIIAI